MKRNPNKHRSLDGLPQTSCGRPGKMIPARVSDQARLSVAPQADPGKGPTRLERGAYEEEVRALTMALVAGGGPRLRDPGGVS
jgi:hypothetical protein